MNRFALALTAVAALASAALPVAAAEVLTRNVPAEQVLPSRDAHRGGLVTVTVGRVETRAAGDVLSPADRAQLGVAAEDGVSVTRFDTRAATGSEDAGRL